MYPSSGETDLRREEGLVGPTPRSSIVQITVRRWDDRDAIISALSWVATGAETRPEL